MESESKGKGRKPQWTAAKVEIMIKAIAGGKSYKDAYTAAMVGHTAFFNHLNNDAEFKEQVKKAEQEYQQWYDTQLVANCKRSLMELICGYEYDETTTESGIDARTGKNVTKTKVTHKKVAPNPTALIFALCNRDPEHWKNRVEQDIKGKLETESKQEISLANVSDELLGKVIDAINNK